MPEVLSDRLDRALAGATGLRFLCSGNMVRSAFAELYARHLGVDGYMTKPFSIDRLLERACELLGGDYIDPETL